MREVTKLIVDNYKGVGSASKYSKEDRAEAIRKALIEANHGSDKITYRDIRDGKCSELFAIVEEAINVTVIEGLPETCPLFNYVDMRNVMAGDELTFKIEKDQLFVVSKVAHGTNGLRRQRITNEKTIEVPTEAHAIKIYEELRRVLAGRVDFNALIAKVSDSFAKDINDAMYACVKAAFGNVAAPYKATGTFTEEKLIDVIDHVEAATGMTAIVLGSKKAVKKITGITGADATSAKEDLYAMGYFGHIGENSIISMKNGHKAGTTDFILDDNALYVIAADEKFIKFVTEGETYIIPGNPASNADLSQEFTMIQNYGCAAAISKEVGYYALG